ncbi:hypothetical protein Hypma_000998 [Hypsizygus marmoreus]|uniref:Uncharacterized protein n=1 Tax=Hypsizygus marmoreus TaxID=39966 RepID=A0A369J8J0_HYPMA|nr:hypothetical protein Hypma_000998 [Hypsizygus marmoreus]
MVDNNSEQQFMLPAPSSAEDDAKKLNLAADGESSIKLDELGPMVVNSDGVCTVSSHSQSQYYRLTVRRN